MAAINALSAPARAHKSAITRLILTVLLLAHLPALAAVFPAQAESLDNGDYAAVNAFVEAQIADLRLPGLALAIVQGDEVLYIKGYGEADRDGRPMTPQTPLMTGSTAKSITALAVMQLVEAGRVQLDAPARTYLPWFQMAGPQDSARITVRQLLNQNSGISQRVGLSEIMAHDQSDNAIEASVRRLADVSLERAPGTGFEYSNSNFNILGLIVQTVSGQSYESYVQQHIFDPLAMRHSFASQDAAMQDGMATGYLTWFGLYIPKVVAFNRGNLPEGYLFCSVEDLAHYLIAQLNGGRYGAASVLSPEGVAAMHQPAVPTGDSADSYAMGWVVGTVDGAPALFHTGDTPNFQTYLLMDPSAKLGVAVMLPANGLAVAGQDMNIGNGVLAMLKGHQPQPFKMRFVDWAKYVGTVALPALIALLWVAWTLYRTVRRRRLALPARGGVLWVLWVIALPLAVDLGMLWVLLFGLPMLWGMPLNGMAFYFTDMFTLIVVAAVAVAGWGIARPLVILKAPQPAEQSAQ